MIGDDRQQSKLFENGSLLHDLIHYVSNGENCKLIFVGDTAQLPPVNLVLSPALDENELIAQFLMQMLHCITLEDVVRQKVESGILFNATRIRKLLLKINFRGLNFNWTDLMIYNKSLKAMSFWNSSTMLWKRMVLTKRS